MAKLSDDLKEAISRLPDKEKNKLLFRLIAKDQALVEKLVFQLIEQEKGISVEDRREKLFFEINETLEEYKKHYYSPGYLLLNLRSISAAITRHLKTTKDKYGEVVLNFFMLNKALELFGQRIQRATPQKQRTLCDYVLKRAVKLLKLLARMHPDIRLDFEDDMMQLGKHITQNQLMVNTAAHHGLNIAHLLTPNL